MNEKTILGGAKKCANTHKSVRYRTLSTTDLVKMCLVGKFVFLKMLTNVASESRDVSCPEGFPCLTGVKPLHIFRQR